MSFLALLRLVGPMRLAAAIGVALLVALVGLQSARLASAKAALNEPLSGRPWRVVANEAQRARQACASERDGLCEALLSQSAAIDRLRQDREARTSAAAAVRRAADLARRDAEHRAELIRSRRVAPDQACEQALRLIRGEGR
jgi:hypothetical protein